VPRIALEVDMASPPLNLFLSNAHSNVSRAAPSQTVKLYGRKYEIVSDPFPEQDGIAIRVKTIQSGDVRTLRIPSTVLQSVFRQAVNKAS